MKHGLFRKIIIVFCTVAAVTGIGFFTYRPPSFLDGITGATKRVSENDKLEGSYIFVMNTDSDCFKLTENRDIAKAALSGSEEMHLKEDVSFTIAVAGDEKALIDFAGNLSEDLQNKGINVSIRIYDRMMLRSRILAGKYDSFISTRGFIEAEALEHSEFSVLDAENMKGQAQ